jgi:hypothetical protein
VIKTGFRRPILVHDLWIAVNYWCIEAVVPALKSSK